MTMTTTTTTPTPSRRWWQRTQPTWAAFRGAAGVFGGLAPEYLDVVAAEAATSVVDVVAVLQAAEAAANAAAEATGGDGPSPFKFRLEGKSWALRYGSGRTSVELVGWAGRPTHLTIEGPIEALDSVVSRVVAAGGPAWDVTSEWCPRDGWCGVPLHPRARHLWEKTHVLGGLGRLTEHSAPIVAWEWISQRGEWDKALSGSPGYVASLLATYPGTGMTEDAVLLAIAWERCGRGER